MFFAGRFKTCLLRHGSPSSRGHVSRQEIEWLVVWQLPRGGRPNDGDQGSIAIAMS